MNKQGDMIVKKSNNYVMEVFEMTGLIDLIIIESSKNKYMHI